jgi:hypothetical protein
MQRWKSYTWLGLAVAVFVSVSPERILADDGACGTYKVCLDSCPSLENQQAICEKHAGPCEVMGATCGWLWDTCWGEENSRLTCDYGYLGGGGGGGPD